jgi:hypothetical protein
MRSLNDNKDNQDIKDQNGKSGRAAGGELGNAETMNEIPGGSNNAAEAGGTVAAAGRRSDVNDAQTANEIPGGSNTNHVSGTMTQVGNAQTANEIPGGTNNAPTEPGAFEAGQVANAQTMNKLQKIDPNSNSNNSPFGSTSDIQAASSPSATQSIDTTSSRDELLDKVSSPEELHTILSNFKSFIDDNSVNSVVSPSLGKVSTSPTSSYGVSYSWEPTNTIMKEEHSILMLKFTDTAGNIIKNRNIDYDILIKDPNTNSLVFQKHGSTPTGVDLKIIDGNSFPIRSSQFNRLNYNVEIDVNSIGGNIVSERASLPKVAVISYNSQ